MIAVQGKKRGVRMTHSSRTKRSCGRCRAAGSEVQGCTFGTVTARPHPIVGRSGSCSEEEPDLAAGFARDALILYPTTTVVNAAAHRDGVLWSPLLAKDIADPTKK